MRYILVFIIVSFLHGNGRSVLLGSPLKKSTAYAKLNDIRRKAGLVPLRRNKLLDKAAQAHADYLVANQKSSHFEHKGAPKFTGARPQDRAIYAGYPIRFVSENFSMQTCDPKASINGLFSAIYHRFSFLSPSIDEVGLGYAVDRRDKLNGAFVYLMGNSRLARLCRIKSFLDSGRYYYNLCKHKAHRIGMKRFDRAQRSIKCRAPAIIVYPYDRQSDVPPVFYDESPDPLPDSEVSGYPISVEFNDCYFRKVSVVSFKLFEGDNHEVRNVRLIRRKNDPNKRFTAFQFALFPMRRLKFATHYRAEISYKAQGKTNTLAWNFSTAKPPFKLCRIADTERTLRLKSAKSYTLYFPPRNAHDLLRHVRYPLGVGITFFDRNTLILSLPRNAPRHFTIEGGDRRVHISVQ